MRFDEPLRSCESRSRNRFRIRNMNAHASSSLKHHDSHFVKQNLFLTSTVVKPHSPRAALQSGENCISPKTIQRYDSSSSFSSASSSRSISSLKYEQSMRTFLSKKWTSRVWGLHFFVAILVLSLGVTDNHRARKYIPIEPKKLNRDCRKAFLNVMASSANEEDAIVCCEGKTSSESIPQLLLGMGLCSEPSPLPFASRLAKVPDAWLLPLFAVLFRVLYWTWQTIFASVPSASSYASHISFTVRRIWLYAVILNFRGWILYVLLNELEDRFVLPFDSQNCWYGRLLHREQAQCIGRAFDFSDHVVLYYVQILPIALVETLYAFQYPYWLPENESAGKKDESNNTRWARWMRLYAMPSILAFSHLYLQVISAAGAYKTAAYFHTVGEIYAGFVVSLGVAVPLMLLQCSDNKYFATARAAFFCYR